MTMFNEELIEKPIDETANQENGQAVMKKVLIADDSRFMRSWLTRILKQYGYHDIYEAIDGGEAIKQFKQIRPDVVFLDITMPRIGGLAALEEIIAIDPMAKVIMCSAMSTESNVVEAIKLGASYFVAKPNFEQLESVLKKLESNT